MISPKIGFPMRAVCFQEVSSKDNVSKDDFSKDRVSNETVRFQRGFFKDNVSKAFLKDGPFLRFDFLTPSFN